MNDSTKSRLAWIIRIIVGFLFVISAIAKMYPSPYFAISTFEVKQLYPMGFSEGFAPYFSRVLIGAELALGILLLQNHFLKKVVIPTTIAMLVIFTAHLSYETFLHGGNSGNCGCFGSLLPMTPIEAIVKNLVALGLLGYLYAILPKRFDRGNFWILTTVSFAAVLAVFMLAPIQPPASTFTVSTNEAPTDTIQTAVIDTVTTVRLKDTSSVKSIAPTMVKDNAPTVETAPPKHKSGYSQYFSSIDNGRKTLCFFVPGCDHCKEAAKELTEMKRRIKDFPEINIVFMNEEADLIPAFFEFAGAQYPYKVIEIIPFWKVLGTGKDTPGVKYLWNGNEFGYFWGIGENKFTPSEYENLITKPYADLKAGKSAKAQGK